VLSSSIGGLEFLLRVVVRIEEYTRVRGYEEARAFNAEFGEDKADGFAVVGAAPAGEDAGQVDLQIISVGVAERPVCLRVVT
jgi:hypothetical protein